MRKIVIYIPALSVLLILMFSCGGSSGPGRKQGEIYGECFKDNSCNEGLVCDTEHNICVRDKDDSDGDDEDCDSEADSLDEAKEDDAMNECRPWEDPDSGMAWSMESNAMFWEDAVDYCDKLTECGYSDWRLPSISEARTLIAACHGTRTGDRCGVTDSCLSTDCLNYNCNLCEPKSDGYYIKIDDDRTSWNLLWSASEVSGSVARAWGIELYTGSVAEKFKMNTGLFAASGARITCSSAKVFPNTHSGTAPPTYFQLGTAHPGSLH